MSLEAVNSNGELFVVPAAFAYTFAVMNTVQDPQNFARTLDCCTGDVFADRVVLLEIQFRAHSFYIALWGARARLGSPLPLQQ